MDRYITYVERLSWLCGLIAATSIAASVLITCQMIFVRYVLGLSTVWQTEMVIYLMLTATLVGMPYVQKLRGHVNVDLVPIYLHGKARAFLAYLAGLTSISVAIILAIHSSHLWWEAWSKDWHSETVWAVPLWIPYSILPVGFWLLALQFSADLVALATGRRRPFDIEIELKDQEPKGHG